MTMKKWLKKWWWTILLFVAGVVATVLVWIGARKKAKRVEIRVQEHVAKAAVEVAKKTAVANAEADAKAKEVDTIMKEDDGKARREKLAKWLDANI